MEPILPFDLITIILLMLPTESLVRFQCVCRAWRDFIRNPLFIKKHFQNQVSMGSNGYVLYVPVDYTTINRSLRLLCDETFEEVDEIELPIDLASISFFIVGSCNGLLCLTNANNYAIDIYVCNPFIEKYRMINHPIAPDVIGSSDQYHVNVALGFGYYDETDDYKIVRIVASSEDSDMNNRVDLVFSYGALKSKVEVYSLMSGSWKDIEVDYFPWMMRDIRSQVVLSESIHWKVNCRDENRHINGGVVILAFHLEKEVFEQISLPDNYEVDGNEDLIGIFKEKLCLFVYQPWQASCCLWLMNEYGVASSWTKTYSITIHPRVYAPLIFTKYDEIIVDDGENLNVCHVDSNTTRILELQEQCFINLVSYEDSLVMIQG